MFRLTALTAAVLALPLAAQASYGPELSLPEAIGVQTLVEVAWAQPEAEAPLANACIAPVALVSGAIVATLPDNNSLAVAELMACATPRN